MVTVNGQEMALLNVEGKESAQHKLFLKALLHMLGSLTAAVKFLRFKAMFT